MKNFDDLFKQSSDTDRHFPFEESSWDDLQGRLERKKKRRPGFWWMSLVLFLGASFLGFYNYWEPVKISEGNEKVETLAPEEKIKITDVEVSEDESEREEIIKLEGAIDQKNVEPTNSSKEKWNPISEQVQLEHKNNQESIWFAKDDLADESEELNNVASLEPKISEIPKYVNLESKPKERIEDRVLVPNLPQGEVAISTQAEDHTSTVEETIIEEQSSPVEIELITTKTFTSDAKVVDVEMEGDPLHKENKWGGSVVSTQSIQGANVRGGAMQNHTTEFQFQQSEESTRQWELGLSLSAFSYEFRPVISLLQENPGPTVYPTVILERDNMIDTLFFNRSVIGERNSRSVQPLFRIHTGLEVSRYITLRGGIVFMGEWVDEKQTDQLISDTEFEYAQIYESRNTYMFVDLGLFLQPNFKRWKPFVGISGLFNTHWKNELKQTVLNSEKSPIEVLGDPSRTNVDWGFGFSGFNTELGVKYQITPKIEIGAQVFTILLPGSNSSIVPSNATDLRLGLLFNYRL